MFSIHEIFLFAICVNLVLSSTILYILFVLNFIKMDTEIFNSILYTFSPTGVILVTDKMFIPGIELTDDELFDMISTGYFDSWKSKWKNGEIMEVV